MGRKPEFNYEQAIERATRLFWAKGYTNTSLRDLLKVMRLGQGSFYHSVKSKRNLYLECLKHYNDTVTRRRWDALTSEPSIKRGVRNFFKMVLDDLDDPKTPNVCLMAGSMTSDLLGAKEIGPYVIGEMKQLQNGVVARFESARNTGELPEDFNAEVSGQIFITFLQGLFRVTRVLNNRSQMERQIETLLGGIGL